VSISALANATDPEGAELTVVGVPDAADLPSGVSYDALNQVFTLDTTDASFQDLGEGDTRTVNISYAISDGKLETPQTATFTITGANDTATATVSAVAAVNEAAYGTVGATVDVNVASYVTINDADTSDVKTPVVEGSLAVSAVLIKDASGAVVPTPAGVTSNLSGLFTTTSSGHITYDREDFSFLKTGQHVEAVFNFSAQSGADVMAKSLTVQINGITETFTAKAIDGYVQGATVFYDPTGSGVYQSGYATSTTDAEGNFTLDMGAQTAAGRIFVKDGIDAMTGQSVGQLMAPTGFGVISPLTTLLSLSNIDEATLKASLGIDASINLATFDPIAAMKTGTAADIAAGELLFTKQQQVYAVIQSVAQLAEGAGGTVSVES
jgi:VCBS repeat-containing protein